MTHVEVLTPTEVLVKTVQSLVKSENLTSSRRGIEQWIIGTNIYANKKKRYREQKVQ